MTMLEISRYNQSKPFEGEWSEIDVEMASNYAYEMGNSRCTLLYLLDFNFLNTS